MKSYLNIIYKATIPIAITSILYFASCNSKSSLNDSHIIATEKYNDTSFVCKTLLDSFLKLNTPRDIKFIYGNRPFKDSIAFLNDPEYRRHIDTVNFKIKFLSKDQICKAIQFEQRTTDELVTYNNVFTISFGKLWDSLYAAEISFLQPQSSIIKNEFIMLPGGEVAKDSCRFYGACMSFLSMQFIKENDTLKVGEKIPRRKDPRDER
jgi:hypothetical protein